MLLIIVVTTGCNRSVASKLISTIDQTCATQAASKCKVTLKDVTPFTWDKLYFFGSWTTSDAIKQAIGPNYRGDDVPDDYRRMLFMQGGKVVYEEDFQSLDYTKSTIEFPDLIDSLSHAKSPFLTPGNALFIADKGKIQGSCEDCFVYSLSALPIAQ
ncbi:MAG: hypothetical protein ACRYG7_17845 [Janthinobacterium lividum]|jgi:hypothetical protein